MGHRDPRSDIIHDAFVANAEIPPTTLKALQHVGSRHIVTTLLEPGSDLTQGGSRRVNGERKCQKTISNKGTDSRVFRTLSAVVCACLPRGDRLVIISHLRGVIAQLVERLVRNEISLRGPISLSPGPTWTITNKMRGFMHFRRDPRGPNHPSIFFTG